MGSCTATVRGRSHPRSGPTWHARRSFCHASWLPAMTPARDMKLRAAGTKLALDARVASRHSLLALTALASCKLLVACGGPACPQLCPAAGLGLSVAVTSSTGADSLSGVQVIASGPTAAELSCVGRGQVTYCDWGGGVWPGAYKLVVSAAGYRTVEVPAVVTHSHDASCGCDSATLTPSQVALDPE